MIAIVFSLQRSSLSLAPLNDYRLYEGNGETIDVIEMFQRVNEAIKVSVGLGDYIIIRKHIKLYWAIAQVTNLLAMCLP